MVNIHKMRDQFKLIPRHAVNLESEVKTHRTSSDNRRKTTNMRTIGRMRSQGCHLPFFH